MSAFFDYPQAAAFGRVLPKSKIYEHANATSKVRQLFVDQVDRITWAYKLAPETTNLEASKVVAEIQIFRIILRAADVDEKILSAIDKAIPFPIIFELNHKAKRKVIAAYKRPSDADKAKWVVSEYFETEWEPEDNPRYPLPSALNLESLYARLLEALIPDSAGAEEPIGVRVQRLEAIRAKQREAERIKTRLANEKQFNKRVAINAELRDVTKALKRLGVTQAAKN